MAAQTFQQEYMQMPPVTRAYTTACVLTTLAVVSENFKFNLFVDYYLFTYLNYLDLDSKNSIPRIVGYRPGYR